MGKNRVRQNKKGTGRINMTVVRDKVVTLYADEVIQQIAEVLARADGEFIEQIAKQVGIKNITHEGYLMGNRTFKQTITEVVSR